MTSGQKRSGIPGIIIDQEFRFFFLTACCLEVCECWRKSSSFRQQLDLLRLDVSFQMEPD